MNGQQKEMLGLVAQKLGFSCVNRKSVIATIIAKSVSLLLGILFVVLRNKAKANGQNCKKNIFTVLAVIFFVGVLTNNAQIPDEDDEDLCDCCDFEDETV
jgi:predicted acetyltransferase